MLTGSLNRRRRVGAALIAALGVLVLLASLALYLSLTGVTGLYQNRNHRSIVDAELAAQSGLSYLALVLRTAEIDDWSSNQAILDSLAAKLDGLLSGSGTLGGYAVGYDGSTITVPTIVLEDGRSFTAQFTSLDGNLVLLNVVGQSLGPGPVGGSVERSIAIELELTPEIAFEYGMFAKGPIVIGDFLNYRGAKDPCEASAFSAAGGLAISVLGGHIDGDVITSEPDATVFMGGTVGGAIRQANRAPQPKVYPGIFEPFATNIVDASTDTSSGTFTNIRIKAGTDPTFGDVSIRGVMYVEAPNKVTFTSNVDIIGVVVSEDPGPGASPLDHSIYFKNNLSVGGLDELPNTPEFATLRTMAGSAFLLPGFTLEFKNNFTTVGGTIAAEQIITKNNLVGTVYGSIIALGDGGLELKNNSTLTIDRSKYPNLATGLSPGLPRPLTPRPSTYAER